MLVRVYTCHQNNTLFEIICHRLFLITVCNDTQNNVSYILNKRNESVSDFSKTELCITVKVLRVVP